MKRFVLYLILATAVTALFNVWPIFAVCVLIWSGIAIFYMAKIGWVILCATGRGFLSTCRAIGHGWWLWRNRKRSRMYLSKQVLGMFDEEQDIFDRMRLTVTERMAADEESNKAFVERLNKVLFGEDEEC